MALLAAAAIIPAQAAFKCTDEKGVSHYEDQPPAACANVPIYEVSKSGAVVRKLETTHAATAPEGSKKTPETDRAAIDRERRDRTLLDTYANEREIDTARDRALDLVKARRQSAESQLALVKKRRAQMEANKGTPKADLESVAKEQATVEHSVAGYDAELARIEAQYETDKVRWRELSARRR